MDLIPNTKKPPGVSKVAITKKKSHSSLLKTLEILQHNKAAGSIYPWTLYQPGIFTPPRPVSIPLIG